MDVRNPQYNADGSIDCEVNHPVYEWIPFTARANDPEPAGRAIYASILAGDIGAIADYVPPDPPPEPTAEELLAAERAAMVVSRFQARAALHTQGLLATVQAVMDDPDTDALAKLAWADAQEFKRTSPTVAAMAAVLELSATDLDDLFRLAATIQA